MERKTRRRIWQDDLEHYLKEPGDYPNLTPTVSAQETTGMIPAPPQSDAQYESYQTLSGMQIPKLQTPDDRAQ